MLLLDERREQEDAKYTRNNIVTFADQFHPPVVFRNPQLFVRSFLVGLTIYGVRMEFIYRPNPPIEKLFSDQSLYPQGIM